MNRAHADELIPAFVVDALDEGDRVLVEGLLSIEPAALARRDRFEALLALTAVPTADDAGQHEADWEALRARLPQAPDPPQRQVRDLPNVLDDRYVLHEELGRGAVGVVYKATDQRTGATVVVRLRLAYQNPARIQARLRRQLEALKSLDHPNLLLPLGSGTVEGIPYTVLPFLDPVRTLHDEGLGRRRWGPGAATRLVRQAGLGLAAAHRQGLVHRDLTPRTLLLESDGTVRVSDLDQVGVGDELTALTRCGAVVGSPFYLSPEAARGGPVDERADVYALGQILYELLTGELVFRGRTMLEVIEAKVEGRLRDPVAVAPDLPPGYREVLGKALATEPGQRYACVEAFLAELDAVERGEPIEPAAAPPWGSGSRLARRVAAISSRAWLLVVALLAVVTVGILRLLGLV